MNNFFNKYQSIVGQVNYTLFLIVVALLPFPQIFLRYGCLIWIFSWLLEGRFCRKPQKQDWYKMLPFIMFGAWYLWRIISGIWVDNPESYAWQLEKYMAFGFLIPIGIWGVNDNYNWKQICKVLVVSCVLAAGVYAFTLFWVYNARIFNSPIGQVALNMPNFDFFAGKISYIKHRLFLCSVELTGIVALLYIRKDIISRYGSVKGWAFIIVAVIVMIAFILSTGSRASILSGIALLTVWSLYKLPIRRTRYKIALLLFACGIGLYALSQHPRMENFDYKQLLSIRDTNQEGNIRLNIWGAAIETPKDYSLYGLGAGQSFQYLQEKYKEHGFTNYQLLNSHNQYIEEWIELGIPGLLFFILVWFSLLYCTKDRARKSAFLFVTLYALNMLTDCMFGRFDGIALWCLWMILIRLQSDTQSHQQTTGNAQ